MNRRDRGRGHRPDVLEPDGCRVVREISRARVPRKVGTRVEVVREALLHLVQPQRPPRAVRADVHLAGFARAAGLEQLDGWCIFEVVVVPGFRLGVQPPASLVARRDGDVLVADDLSGGHQCEDVAEDRVDVRLAFGVWRVPALRYLGVFAQGGVYSPSSAVFLGQRDVDVGQEGFLVSLRVVVRDLSLPWQVVHVVRDYEHAARALTGGFWVGSGAFWRRIRHPLVVAEVKHLVRREPPSFPPPAQRSSSTRHEPDQLVRLEVPRVLSVVRVRAVPHHPPRALLRHVVPLRGVVELKLLKLVAHRHTGGFGDGVPFLAVPRGVALLEEAHEYVREHRREVGLRPEVFLPKGGALEKPAPNALAAEPIAVEAHARGHPGRGFRVVPAHLWVLAPRPGLFVSPIVPNVGLSGQ